VAATQHVPLVWLDCFWTTAISRRAEHEHQPESPNHRKLIFDLTNEVERLQSAVALRPPLPDD